MEWPAVEGLLRYWHKNPPLHEMIAQYLDVKTKDLDEMAAEEEIDVSTKLKAEEFDSLLASYGIPPIP